MELYREIPRDDIGTSGSRETVKAEYRQHSFCSVQIVDCENGCTNRVRWLRGNRERWMEDGFGVAEMNRWDKL